MFFTSNSRMHGLFKMAKQVKLLNSDTVHIDDHVIVHNIHNWSTHGPTLIGRLVEILHLTSEHGTIEFGLQYPDSILIEVSEMGSFGCAYKKPSIWPLGYLMVAHLKVQLQLSHYAMLSEYRTHTGLRMFSVWLILPINKLRRLYPSLSIIVIPKIVFSILLKCIILFKFKHSIHAPQAIQLRNKTNF